MTFQSVISRIQVRVLWIVGGLLAQIALIKLTGFSIATGVLFAMTARGMGRVSLPLAPACSGISNT